MTKIAMVIAVLTVAGCAPVETSPLVEGPDASSAAPGEDGSSDTTPPGKDPSAPALDGGTTPPPPTPPAATPLACARDTAFPAVFAIAEASAAVEIAIGGVPHMLVTADSNNEGDALLIPLPGGAAPRKIVLPYDEDASDDFEGLATSGGAVYALTSSGAVTRFLPNANGLTRDGAAYRIGAAPLSCPKLTSTNCGKNWEGLCLRRKAPAAGQCAGYAASKAEGKLYCVKMQGTTLSIDTAVTPLALAVPADALSDCAFGGAALVVTTNDVNGSKSYVVDEKTGALAPLPVTGHGSNEAIQVGADGAAYQFEDSSSNTSAASRYACKGL